MPYITGNHTTPMKTEAKKEEANKNAIAADATSGLVATDNPRVWMSEDGDTAFVFLKRKLSAEKHNCVKLIDASELTEGKVLDKIKLRVPRVSDRLTVSKMQGTIANPVAFEFQMIAKISELPDEILQILATGDWENVQDALGKLTD